MLVLHLLLTALTLTSSNHCITLLSGNTRIITRKWCIDASVLKSIEMRIIRRTKCRQHNCLCCVLNRAMCFDLKRSSTGRMSKMHKRKFVLLFFNPMPPHVLVDFVVLPPGHGRSVTDFWGWDAHETQLRCPDDVSGDRERCSARRALKPKFY